MESVDGNISCGIAIPQVFTEDPIDLDLIRKFASRAEDLGYDSLWVQERIIGTADSLEPLNLLSYLAASTKSIRLGTAVIIATTRNPFLLAKELCTIDNLSKGRLTLGLALGGRIATYPLLGAPREKRVRHFIEFLSVIKALWTSGNASHHGEFWDFDSIKMRPLPVQETGPPIWFGGRHIAALKRAATMGDGWMGAGSTSTGEFREHVEVIRSELERIGKSESEFTISKRVYVAIDDDEERAKARLSSWFGAHYGNADLSAHVSVWGSVAKCIEGIQQVVNSGAEMLMFNPVFDHMDHLEKLRYQVIPKLSYTLR